MLAVITMVSVPVDEALDNIVMKSRKVLIHMECGGKAYWVRLLGEVRPTQSYYKWVYCITNPPSGEEITNIDWIIVKFPGTKKNDGRPDPGIKSCAQPVKALKDLLKNKFNLKG